MKSNMYVSLSGYFVVLAQNCLASTLDYIVMQMRKTNREKGFRAHYARNDIGSFHVLSRIILVKIHGKFPCTLKHYARVGRWKFECNFRHYACDDTWKFPGTFTHYAR